MVCTKQITKIEEAIVATYGKIPLSYNGKTTPKNILLTENISISKKRKQQDIKEPVYIYILLFSPLAYTYILSQQDVFRSCFSIVFLPFVGGKRLLSITSSIFNSHYALTAEEPGLRQTNLQHTSGAM